jgi:hypothetical protein
MSKRYDPDDPVALDKWTRDYCNIPDDENTDAYMIRVGLLADTPRAQAKRLAMALAWIEPHAPREAQPMIDGIKSILGSFEKRITIELDAEQPPSGVIVMPSQPLRINRPPPLTKVDALELDKGELLFEQAKALYKLQPAVDAQQRLKQAQRERASKPRKFDEDKAKRAAGAYHDIKAGRAAYGGVKELAREYGVSEATIRAAARRYPPTSIEK